MNKDINEEYLEKFKILAEEMENRVLTSRVIKDHKTSDGERIVVTETADGVYGYAVYEPYKDEPHYIAEGNSLIEDLDKTTDYADRGLRYTGAKSMVQRNMLGVFREYVKDPGFEAFYVSIQTPTDASIKVAQQMTGYDDQDPVTLVHANFDSKSFGYASVVQMLEDENTKKPVLRIGTGGLKPDGTPDTEAIVDIAIQAEKAKEWFGIEGRDEERIKELTEEFQKNAQSIFYPIYTQLQLPMYEGIRPVNILEEGFKKESLFLEDELKNLEEENKTSHNDKNMI